MSVDPSIYDDPESYDMPHLQRRRGESYEDFLLRSHKAGLQLIRLHANPKWRDYKRRLDEAEKIAEHGLVDKEG